MGDLAKYIEFFICLGTKLIVIILMFDIFACALATWLGIGTLLQQCLHYFVSKVYSKLLTFTYIRVARRQLEKKTLVLHLKLLVTTVVIKNDQILDDSHGVPFDLELDLPEQNAKCYVYKRPFVEYFLRKLSEWYRLVVVTNSFGVLAKPILGYLDAGRYGRFFYDEFNPNLYDVTKTIALLNSKDISRYNERNAIPMGDCIIAKWDLKMLTMLSFLEALRFVKDVRAILKRRDVAFFISKCIK